MGERKTGPRPALVANSAPSPWLWALCLFLGVLRILLPRFGAKKACLAKASHDGLCCFGSADSLMGSIYTCFFPPQRRLGLVRLLGI
jgi:hypothetical protein